MKGFSYAMKENSFITHSFWDRLGPGTLCCSTYTWTNVSSSNKIQRKYKELKMTTCISNWARLWTTRYKKTKETHCHFWRARSKIRVSWAKAGYYTCLPGASMRNSAHGRGHKEGGFSIRKGGSSLRKPPVPEHLSPKLESTYFTVLCSHLYLWLYGGLTPITSLGEGVNLQL